MNETTKRQIREREPVVTTTMFTEVERAAWEVAVARRLAIDPADLRALLDAAEQAEDRGLRR